VCVNTSLRVAVIISATLAGRHICTRHTDNILPAIVLPQPAELKIGNYF